MRVMLCEYSFQLGDVLLCQELDVVPDDEGELVELLRFEEWDDLIEEHENV